MYETPFVLAAQIIIQGTKDCVHLQIYVKQISSKESHPMADETWENTNKQKEEKTNFSQKISTF